MASSSAGPWWLRQRAPGNCWRVRSPYLGWGPKARRFTFATLEAARLERDKWASTYDVAIVRPKRRAAGPTPHDNAEPHAVLKAKLQARGEWVEPCAHKWILTPAGAPAKCHDCGEAVAIYECTECGDPSFRKGPCSAECERVAARDRMPAGTIERAVAVREAEARWTAVPAHIRARVTMWIDSEEREQRGDGFDPIECAAMREAAALLRAAGRASAPSDEEGWR